MTWAVATGSVVAVSLALRLLYRQWQLAQPVRRWPNGVEVRPSRIRGGGLGLFAWRAFAAGETLGEYRGRVLTLLQAHKLEDRDYLMGGFG